MNGDGDAEIAAGTTDDGSVDRRGQRSGWRQARRFLLATLTLALMYIALEGAWQWVALQLMYSGWTWDGPAAYADQAAKVAEESKPREAVLSQQHPHAVFQFGVEYGYLGELPQGSRTPEEMAKIRALHVQKMVTLAQFLGLGVVEPLPVMPEAGFLALTQRLENDVGGVAGNVEQLTSPRLRHVFMLGAHAGSELARLELGGEVPVPAPAEPIGLHGTLAGVPMAVWRPLTRVSRSPDAALSNYRLAVDALDGYLAGVPLPVPSK